MPSHTRVHLREYVSCGQYTCTHMRPACVPRPPAEEVSARTFTPAHCCQVGCSTLEVQAALWKPTTSNAFTLFQSSEAVRARTAAAGVPFAEMSKLVSKLWDEAKRNGTSSPFEVYHLCLCACVACAIKPAPVSDAHSCLSVCVCAWVCRCRRLRRSTQ